MVTVFHHTPVKRCIVFKQFDGLNFDGSAGKCQNFPSQNFALYSIFLVTVPSWLFVCLLFIAIPTSFFKLILYVATSCLFITVYRIAIWCS